MQRNVILFAVILVTTIGSIGCGGSVPNTNKAATNVNSDPLATTKPKVEEVTNNAPTLSPAVKAYCEAWAKNDEAALRKVYSSDTIKDFESQMKDAKEKSLLKFLEDDKVAATPCEATNEQITGDNATVRVVLSIYPKGLKVVFVKENGEWKLTNKVPDIDSVTKSAANTNTASDKAK